MKTHRRRTVLIRRYLITGGQADHANRSTWSHLTCSIQGNCTGCLFDVVSTSKLAILMFKSLQPHLSDECQLVPNVNRRLWSSYTHSLGWVTGRLLWPVRVFGTSTCCQHRYVWLMIVCALRVCWKHNCLIEAAALSDFCLFSCAVNKLYYLLTYLPKFNHQLIMWQLITQTALITDFTWCRASRGISTIAELFIFQKKPWQNSDVVILSRPLFTDWL